MHTHFTLYSMRRSGPGYKVALMFRLCGVAFNYVNIDLDAGEQRLPSFLAKSRFGQVPCVEHNGAYFCQSPSILEYLSAVLQKFEGETLVERTHIREWLSWDLDRLSPHLFRARGVNIGIKQAHEVTQILDAEGGAASLALLNHKLALSDWLVSDRPTVADINVYGVVYFAGVGGFALENLPYLSAWAKRIEALPGYGTHDAVLPKPLL